MTVALSQDELDEMLREARNEALEEAACLFLMRDLEGWESDIVAEIRALKDAQ